MKTKKILLPGMMAALAFAACTNEEIVTMPNAAPEVDLSNRPVIGMVDLSFGPESQTRLALDENGIYSSIAWAPTDKMGARIIDEPNSNNYSDHSLNYSPSDYASSNYKYTRGENGVWSTEALMVEGNYMFYAPYDENARGREALQVEFPINQTIDPASTLMKGVNVDAIRNFYGNDGQYVVAIGHKFLSAKENTTSYKVNYNHLYAFPKITLKNDYKDPDWTPAPGQSEANRPGKAIKVSEVVIVSDNIHKFYNVDHSEVIAAYQDASAKDVVKDRTDGYNDYTGSREQGLWRLGNPTTYLKTATTEDVLDGIETVVDKVSQDGKIVVTFKSALEIPAGGSYSFNVVMPAAVYAKGDVELEVHHIDGDKTYEWTSSAFVENFANLTYAPGNQYPTEEYNFDGETPVLKNTQGALATYSVAGEYKEVGYKAPKDGFVTNAQFINFLSTIKDNSLDLTEGTKAQVLAGTADFFFADGHEFILDSKVMAAAEQYLTDGSITFTTGQKAYDKDHALTITDKYEFASLTIDGNVVLDGVSVGGKLTQNSGSVELKGTTTATAATFKGAATLTDAKITGAVEFLGGATITKLIEATAATIKNKKVVINDKATAVMGNIALESGELEVNVANYFTATSQLTIGTWNNTTDKPATSATLTAKKDIDATYVKLIAGEVVAEANIIAGPSFSGSWKSGQLTIDGSHKPTGTFVIPALGVYEFNGKIADDATGVIVNNGTIYNNATLKLNENEGKIIAGENSSTYVASGSVAGSIDNTNKTALFLDAAVENIVSYTFSEQATSATIEALKTKNYSINKVIFNAGINFDKNFTAADVFWGVDYIDLKGNISIAEGVMIGVNVLKLNVLDNVTIDGFSQALSGLGFTDATSTTITVAKNKTLTIKEAGFGSANVNNELDFVFEQPAAEDAPTVKAGALKLEAAYVGVGTAGTVPSGDNVVVDAYSSLTQEYWNGSAWQ